MARRLYTFDIVSSVRKSIEYKLKSRLERAVHDLEAIKTSREIFQASARKVIAATSKEEKDRAVSDCAIYLQGLRKRLADIREHLDAAEASLTYHSDFETLLLTMEKDAESGEEMRSFHPERHFMRMDPSGKPYSVGSTGGEPSGHSEHASRRQGEGGSVPE